MSIIRVSASGSCANLAAARARISSSRTPTKLSLAVFSCICGNCMRMLCKFEVHKGQVLAYALGAGDHGPLCGSRARDAVNNSHESGYLPYMCITGPSVGLPKHTKINPAMSVHATSFVIQNGSLETGPLPVCCLHPVVYSLHFAY